jgi:hypothetical protein
MPLSSVVGAQSIVKPGVCTSSTRPASPYDGQVIYETDTDLIKAYNGTAWVQQTTGVIQVKSTTVTASTFSTSSSSLVDITGLSVSITPTSASNKILVMATVSCGITVATELIYATLARNGTTIGGGTDATIISEGRTDSRAYNFSTQFLDSPATTSATTYNVRTLANAGGYTFHLNRRGASDLYRGISTITVMEVTP